MIEIDVHEPVLEATRLIAPVVPCKIEPLNEQGWADYKWTTHDGSVVQVERKQWQEVLSGLDKVEEQLRRHLDGRAQKSGRTLLLLEGMATPVMEGTCQLKPTNNNRVYVLGYSYRVSLSQVYAWLYNVSRYMEIIQTSSFDATCMALTAMYKNDQKEEHSTFKRHFKQVSFFASPQVTNLMGLFPNIGEKRAEALIKEFVTAYRVLTASVEELVRVPGIGPTLAKTMLRSVGRIDV